MFLMTMNGSLASDWTSSLGNGRAIGTGQRANPSMGGSAITEARDTSQATRERLASDHVTHAVDGTGYAGTNEDVGQSSESGQFYGLSKGLTNGQYAHDANPGYKGGDDVARVDLMRASVGYARGGGLASPMGAAITSLMRKPAGEIKQPTTTLSATGSKENDGQLERRTKLKLNKGEELLATQQSKGKEKEIETKNIERYAQNCPPEDKLKKGRALIMFQDCGFGVCHY